MLEAAGFRVRVTRERLPAASTSSTSCRRARVIHDAFEEHITTRPGMERIGEFVTGRILPTPGAVLIAAETAGRGARRPRRRRRRRRDHRRALDHRRQPRDRARSPPSRSRTQAHGRGRPRHVRERARTSPSCWTRAERPRPAAARAAERRRRRSPPPSRSRASRPSRRAAPRRAPRAPLHAQAAARPSRAAAISPRAACSIGTGGALTRLPGGVAMLEAARGARRRRPAAAARRRARACSTATTSSRAAARCSARFPPRRVVALMRASIGPVGATPRSRMLAEATVTVDLAKIDENTRRVVRRAARRRGRRRHEGDVRRARGRRARCSRAASARSASRGSRTSSACATRASTAPIWLLRAPTPALADETVRLTDVSLASEIDTVEALDAAAARGGHAPRRSSRWSTSATCAKA